MKAKDMTRSDLIAFNRKKMRSLKARLARVSTLGENAPTYAQDVLQSIKEQKGNYKWSELTDRQLRDIYRDLIYADSLKSSRYYSAKRMMKDFEPIKEKVSVLSKAKQKEFWDVYGKLYERGTVLFEKFKYEIFQTASDVQYSGGDLEQLVGDIIHDFDETLLKGYAADSSEFSRIFTTKLHKRANPKK